MNDKICDFCGTINNSHHSAACVDNQKQSGDRHKSHKQAIVEKWTQRPDSSKYKGDGSTSDFICDTDDYIDKLESDLAEAQAEIEKFNNLFKNGINCFASPCERHSGENTPPFDEFIKKYGYKCTPCLVEELERARAEIERLNKNTRFAIAINSAMQEASQDLPDLRGHECLAKHKLLSLFDLWQKKVKPRLPGLIDDEISQRDELIKQMREALKACVEFIHYYDQEHNIGDGKVLEQATFALLVSERGEG